MKVEVTLFWFSQQYRDSVQHGYFMSRSVFNICVLLQRNSLGIGFHTSRYILNIKQNIKNSFNMVLFTLISDAFDQVKSIIDVLYPLSSHGCCSIAPKLFYVTLITYTLTILSHTSIQIMISCKISQRSLPRHPPIPLRKTNLSTLNFHLELRKRYYTF